MFWSNCCEIVRILRSAWSRLYRFVFGQDKARWAYTPNNESSLGRSGAAARLKMDIQILRSGDDLLPSDIVERYPVFASIIFGQPALDHLATGQDD